MKTFPPLLPLVLCGLAVLAPARPGRASSDAGGEAVRAEAQTEAVKGAAAMNTISLQFIDYRNDPAELARRVDALLAAVPPEAPAEDPVALIAPHAGYVYSGPVAAFAYRTVQGRKYDTVIVVGPSHRVPLRGISILDVDSFESPLGSIPCDRDAIATLLDAHEDIVYRPEAHAGEHSLEVQVPFLQRALSGFRIVFAVVGSPGTGADEAFTEALARIARKGKTLIVASSDLSHYHSYDRANRMDRLALQSIVDMRPDELRKNISAGSCEMCGYRPVLAVMSVARKLGAVRVKLLQQANSGDTAGPKNQVVGYAAVAFYAGKNEEGEGALLDDGARRELIRIAKQSIEGTVRDGRSPEPTYEHPALAAPRGAFVTIKKKGKLRGCIGSFGIGGAEPLYRTVSQMAAAAAVKDPRFQPLTADEIPDIDIEISALTPLRKVDDPGEVEVGRHGIYIRKGYRSGVLLPQVATEYGWDRATFLNQTCLKAGLPPDEWKKGASISVFEAEVFGED